MSVNWGSHPSFSNTRRNEATKSAGQLVASIHITNPNAKSTSGRQRGRNHRAVCRAIWLGGRSHEDGRFPLSGGGEQGTSNGTQVRQQRHWHHSRHQDALSVTPKLAVAYARSIRHYGAHERVTLTVFAFQEYRT